MASVIVPAHNEARVIRRCLDSIMQQTAPVETVIVACNGCTDNTVELVQRYYPQVICLDIRKPSKTHALNEAEKHVSSFPVFYLDADTVISPATVQTITHYMDTHPDRLLAAPMPQINTTGSSWFVKQYYRIWLELPYIREGVIGTCSFIMSEAGRQRFDRFPAVINDDGFVRCCFDRHERGNIEGTAITIQAPKTLYSLIKIKTRARLGNMQLDALQLCARPKQADYSGSLKARLFSKACLPTLIYIFIALIIRLRARYQFNHLDNYTWETDHTSR